MKVGLALPTQDMAARRPARLPELARIAREAEAMGFDSLWVMDHFWIDEPAGRRGAHDPMVTLAYLAAATTRAQLGVLVACNSFRHPGQLGREALALADASEGRFILGLGAGWHEPEYDSFGFPFDRKVGRLAETLEVLPRLLRGERVSYEGRFLHLRDASVLTTSPPPPLWIAAFSPRMLSLTARYAQGWNTAWFGPDTTRFREQLSALHDALEVVERPRREVEVSAAVFVLPGEEEEDGVIAGAPERVAEALRAYGEAGADQVIVSLARNPFMALSPAYLDRMAEALPHLRA